METTKQSLHQASSNESTSTSALSRQNGRQNGRQGSQGRRSQFQPATTNGNSRTSAEQLARGLGWFSIGLGLAELLAPRAMAKITGVRRENAGLIQLFGIREIASGVAIFMQGDQPATALWSRVAGDALDLASLGIAMASPDSNKARVGFATANVLAVTALDVLCAQQFSRGSTDSPSTQTRKSLIIDRPAEELYQAWRNFEQLPRFMRNLESVTVGADGRSHWVAKTPAGLTVKWDAEIVEDTPGQVISWRSVEDSEINNSGSVRFRPAHRKSRHHRYGGVELRSPRRRGNQRSGKTSSRRSRRPGSGIAATLQADDGSWGSDSFRRHAVG